MSDAKCQICDITNKFLKKEEYYKAKIHDLEEKVKELEEDNEFALRTQVIPNPDKVKELDLKNSILEQELSNLKDFISNEMLQYVRTDETYYWESEYDDYRKRLGMFD